MHFDPGTVPIVKRTSKGEFLVNAGTFGVIAVANGISNVCVLYRIIRNFTSPLTQFSATPSGVGKDSPQRSNVHLSVCHRVVRGHNTGTRLQPVGPAVCARNTISCESSHSLSFSPSSAIHFLILTSIGVHISSRMVAILAIFLASSMQLTIALSTTSLRSPSRNK